MLKSKGLNVEYISSEKLNHAWNAVSIDGKWYEADVTWDTLGSASYGKGKPETKNRHTYFLLTDLLFRTIDEPHVGQPQKFETMCTSMESNYFVRNGYAENWLNESVETKLNLQLKEATETVTVKVNSRPEYEDDTSMAFEIPDKVCAAAMAQVLNGSERTGAKKRQYTLSAYSKGASLTVTALRNGIDYSGMVTLEIPKNISVISSESFSNTAAQVIIIPEGVTYVASNAFTRCKKLKYIVNRSSLSIIPPKGVNVIQE